LSERRYRIPHPHNPLTRVKRDEVLERQARGSPAAAGTPTTRPNDRADMPAIPITVVPMSLRPERPFLTNTELYELQRRPRLRLSLGLRGTKSIETQP
jgi:hypothetical protein